MRRLVVRHLVAGASTLLIFPALCFAQFGAIAGVIKDDSGAVLPGVTVEASSPALIEKTRTAVSDSAGQYRVEQLRPGVYTVTFTLQGFTVIRREGIEISAGFTAPVNPSLRVSAITETITVSGEAPVLDVQSSSERKQLSKEALDALPSARSFATLGTTIPGVTANQRDVGGTQGERGNVLSAHGGSGFDMTVQLDGVALGNMSPFAGSAWSNFSLNDAAAQEMVFETGAVSVEAATGGVRVNVVPREGGNRFSGSAFGNFSKRSMSRSNYTPELQARGLRAPAGFDSLVDESVGIGGPIRRDRLWFFGAHRYRSNVLKGSNQFFSIDPLAYTYNPDLTRPLNAGGFDMDNQVRGLDPDKEGAIIWEHRIGKGTVTGGSGAAQPTSRSCTTRTTTAS
jgi:Carboxypeptidase regulatory-like domain